MESEYRLHIQAAAGSLRPILSLRHDHGGGAHELRKDHGSELVSGERAKAETLRIIRISVYSDNLAIFWKSVQEAFFRAGSTFCGTIPAPQTPQAADCWWMISAMRWPGRSPMLHFHRRCSPADRQARLAVSLYAGKPAAFKCASDRCKQGPFSARRRGVRLGAKVYQIGTDQLRLNHTELAVYAHRCGTELSDAQVERLLYSSEGWFSAVYLNLRTLSERGVLPSRHSDIYATFTAAMIDPLPERAGGRFWRSWGLPMNSPSKWREVYRRRWGRGADPLCADGAERLCHAPAGRRYLSLPPHDEGVCRAQLSGDAGGNAAALLGALRSVV